MIRVVMVGPDPAAGQGGMATVAATLLRHGTEHVDLRAVAMHADGSVARRLRAWATGSLRVVGLLATRRVDVLHVHVSERGSVLRKGLIVVATTIARVPVLLHCHGARFFDWYETLPAPARHAIAWMFRRANLVVTLGEPSRARYVELLRLDPARVVVAPNAITLPDAVPDRGGHITIGLLFLGRFGDRKGSADLLAAVVELPQDVQEIITLRMAGDGEVDETRTLAEELGVRAEISGWLTPEQRDEALRAAQIFVLPSRQEELPMAMLEAMGWGLAPIVTPVGSIPEVISDERNGLLVRPGEIAELSKAIHRAVTDDDLRIRLADAARSTAERFDAVEYTAAMARRWVSLVPHRSRSGAAG
ncbi:MAG TPA: glycosyltransferase family 4 protein [Pseudonocardiaceae bacterium]|nr:glycosyltransferase family 4 protein [Pseudonocardiaceae bacterium]